ncbi:hypothetical protein ACFQX6_11580 [Streptosporangium lutulentum]
MQLNLVPELQKPEEHRQSRRPPGAGGGLGIPQHLAEVDIGVFGLHLPQWSAEPVSDQLQVIGIVADGAVGQPG